MKKESCGHSLSVPSCILLKSETAKTTHMPQVAVITGTWGIKWHRRLATIAIPTEYFLASKTIFHVLEVECQEGHAEDWHLLTHIESTALARRGELVPGWGWWQHFYYLPVHAQSARHHSTSVAEGSSSSDTSCSSLAQMKWVTIKKKKWSIWSFSSDEALNLSLPEAGMGSERRKIFCPREKTAVFASSVAYWTGRKNMLDFPFWGKICFPFQNLREIDFVVSLLLCCALGWEGSQQHRSRLWHMHTLWHGQWAPLIWIYLTPPHDTSLPMVI